MLTHAPQPATAAMQDYRYCEWNRFDKTVELFDYTTDPYELKNIAGDAPAAHLAALHDRLQALRTCQGNVVHESACDAHSKVITTIEILPPLKDTTSLRRTAASDIGSTTEDR